MDQVREYRKYLDDHRRRYLKTKAILIGEEADDRAKTVRTKPQDGCRVNN